MPQDPFVDARNAMVENQILARGIQDDAVLNAMRKVPRHLFVPTDLQPQAYADHPLPIGHQQTISQPFIVAAMTMQLDLEASDRVLEIGTGSGYQAAVLAELVDEVNTIEIVAPLAERAAQALKKAGYTHVNTRIGDGYHGWPAAAPFDAIIVTAAPATIPQPLIDQLKTGGHMVIPVGPVHAVQQLKRLTKNDAGQMEEMHLMDVRFVPLTREPE